MKRSSMLWILGVALGWMLIQAWSRAEQTPLTEQELNAVLPYDLGPATVDVSKYPAAQKEDYQLFLKRCALCHTSARSINFPLVSREDWVRFIQRMHGRAHGELVDEQEMQRIADFLAYDSATRKLRDPEAFARLQYDLDQRYAEVKKERARLIESGKACSKTNASGPKAIP